MYRRRVGGYRRRFGGYRGRRYGGRAPRRGGLYRRRKAGFKKNLALMAGLVNWKMKMTFDLYPNSSGEVKIGMAYNGNPAATTTQASNIITYDSSGALAGLAFTDTLDAAVLDQIRCAGIGIKFYPGFPPGAIQLTTGYMPLAIIYDRDGIETTLATTTFNDIVQQVHRIKVKNQFRPWKTFHKSIKYGLYNKIPTIGEGNVAETNQNLWGQWHRSSSNVYDGDTVYGCQGMILGKALDTTAFPVGTSLGTVVVTGYFQYKDRR